MEHSVVTSATGSLVVPVLTKLYYGLELVAGKHTRTDDIKNALRDVENLLLDTTGKGDSRTLKTKRQEGIDLCDEIRDFLTESQAHLKRTEESGILQSIGKYAYNIAHICCLCVIADKIVEINGKVAPLKKDLGIFIAPFREQVTSLAASTDRLQNRHIAPISDAAQKNFVGMAQSQQELVDQLQPTVGEQLRVITVTGIGGAGKTTLVRRVYADQNVQVHFNCSAWVPVGTSLSTKELLKNVIRRLHKRIPETIDMMDTDELADVVRRLLEGKSYIMVLDDVWKRSGVEDLLTSVLPQENYGRIIITSRHQDISQRSDTTIELEPLSADESQLLFYKKTFRSEICPEELRVLVGQILQLCAGLPLAIDVIGGLLLRKEPNARAWRNYLSEFLDSGTLPAITEVLAMSIDDLHEIPTDCLLYFSIFPRDSTIRAADLIRLWIAEGFIPQEEGRTLEQTAENYLNILTNCGIIQVAEYYDYGRIRGYKVNDFFHRIIRQRAEGGNFSASSMRPNVQMCLRRLSVQDTTDDIPQNVRFATLRSFFMFKQKSNVPNIFPSNRSLRVLSLEDSPLTDRLLNEITTLTHLRYLKLRNAEISRLPNSLKNLRCLLTLDLKGTHVSALPKGILKLESLQHLLVYCYDKQMIYGVKVPKGIGRLKELQTISVVDAIKSSKVVKELRKLSQLRRLGVVNLRSEDGHHLCTAISAMSQLCSLSLTSADNQSLDLVELSAVPSSLLRLYLRGELRTSQCFFPSLRNIVRLRLRGSRLGQDPFQVLKDLQELAELSLIQAYDGLELCCRGGFQNLKILDLDQISNLTRVTVEGAMPLLQKMIIRNCNQLEKVPLGIENLENLKELRLFDMPEQFLLKLRRDGEDHGKVRRIENICYYKGGIPRNLTYSNLADLGGGA